MTTGAVAPTAPRRGAWAGRWWLPGVVVAVGAGVLAGVLAEGWDVYEAGGCGSPGAKFACLVESLVAAAAAAALGPAALWVAYRRAGVPRALPGVLLAAAVGLVLLTLTELVVQVGVLLGQERVADGPSGVVVGLVVGLAALAGGLAQSGPHRTARAVVAGVALAALVGSVLLLQGPVERASTRLELERARVPLLVPVGWGVHSPYVGESGDLSYEAVPDGWTGPGYDGVDVSVTTPDRHLDTCGFRACTDDGDVRVEVPEPRETGRSAWRVVGDVVVTARTYDDDGPDADLADLLRSLEPVTVEQAVDRLYVG